MYHPVSSSRLALPADGNTDTKTTPHQKKTPAAKRKEPRPQPHTSLRANLKHCGRLTCLQCGDHTYNATAVTFHFGPRFRASVSGLGFRASSTWWHPPQVPHGACYMHNCTTFELQYAASCLNYYLLRMQHEAEVPSAETWWSTTWSEARNRGPK